MKIKDLYINNQDWMTGHQQRTHFCNTWRTVQAKDGVTATETPATMESEERMKG